MEGDACNSGFGGDQWALLRSGLGSGGGGGGEAGSGGGADGADGGGGGASMHLSGVVDCQPEATSPV